MKIHSSTRPKLSSNQSGQAAIFITLILMVVVSIIALGVYEVSARSSREALDSQLSIQANYAAESGVNDAINVLNNGGAPGGADCGSFVANNGLSAASQINSSTNVAYTCVTTDGAPGSIAISADHIDSTVVKIQPSGGTGPITFTWGPHMNADPIGNCTAALQFVPPQDWDCPFPVLRVDLFDDLLGAAGYTPSPGLSASDKLELDTDSFFFVPTVTSSGNTLLSPIHIGAATLATVPLPQVLYAACSTVPDQCKMELDLDALTPYPDGYARITTIYGDAPSVTITGAGSTTFSGSQIEIDSTGIARDETQRIDVRVSATPGLSPVPAPNAAVDAGAVLCKRYTLEGGSGPTGGGPGSTASPDQGAFGPGGTWPLCGGALKPAIYLYPTHTELANVKVSYPTGLKTTTPTYNPSTGWEVLAHPDGSLTNVADGKSYPYLYWEGNTDNFSFDMTKGFVVPGKDTAAFLTHELSIIGLKNNEISGFLQFWVPKMKNNPYSLIHFAGSDYTSMAPLTITPKPDSVLRVFMAEEPINQPVKVTPQQFTTFHRTGFTVVEWGGSVLN